MLDPLDIKAMQEHTRFMKATRIVECPNPLAAQALELFNLLDDRGQLTTLALLATAVKLHPKVAA